MCLFLAHENNFIKSYLINDCYLVPYSVEHCCSTGGFFDVQLLGHVADRGNYTKIV